MMDQEIIEVPYSDNGSTQVITIDLPHPPSGPNSQDAVQTIDLYAPGVTTMTQLQSSETVAQITVDDACNNQLESSSKYDHHQHHPDTIKTNNCSVETTIEEHDNVAVITNHSLDDNIHQNCLDRHNLQRSTAETNNNNNINNINNDPDEENHSTSNGSSKTQTRFKWTKEKSQVAMNLVKHGCKPKLVSVAVGCSLRTAQKFVETVTPKIEGDSFKNYEIRRRGRKSKDVNHRLEAIKEVLSKDSTKTQVEIAADLKVSNTTVCRDLKRIGASWREKKTTDNQTGSNKREMKKERQSITNKNKSPSSPTTRGSKGKSKPRKSPS